MPQKLGKEFEQAVAKVQSMFDSVSEITTNEKLVDRLGQSREFDVVVRTRSSGFDLLGVIECKDLKRKVDIQVVDAFQSKASDALAHFKVIVSKSGFTKNAIERARFHGIGTLSLLPGDADDFDIGLHVGVKIYWIDQLTIQVLQSHENINIEFSPDDVLISGKKVIDWYKNYILDNYQPSEEIGEIMGVEVIFDDEHEVVINGKTFLCNGFHFSANRNMIEKSKKINIAGSGFYDWQENKIKCHDQSSISLSGIDLDFHNWPDKRAKDSDKEFGFTILAMNQSFEYVSNAIKLEEFN